MNEIKLNENVWCLQVDSQSAVHELYLVYTFDKFTKRLSTSWP